MQVDEPLSVASTDALLVSPPAQMIEEIFVSDLLATSFKLSIPDTTAKGFFARLLETLQDEPQALELQEYRDRYQLKSLEKSESDEGTTIAGRTTDGNETPIRVQRDEKSVHKTVLKAHDKVTVETSDTKQKRMWNTANKNKVEEKNKDKMWFDILPVVLENIKTYNREHVRQLSLPRCIKCARVRDAHKAVIRCTQKDCIVLDRPLCLMCWKSYHESLEVRQHRGQNTSACPQCQLDWAVYWCAECDLNFCKKCFEHIHSVSATTSHRKIATEDAPGTCFVTSHWSATFQNMIVDMIASRKQKISSNPGGSTIGAKRTRNIEVIVIDEEEDEEERASQQNGSSTGEENELMRPSDADSQLQQDASGNTDYQASTNKQSMLLVIPFLQESARTRPEPLAFLSQQTGLAYSTSSTSNDANTGNIDTGVGNLQWDASTFQLAMIDSGTTASATSVTGNGMMQVTRSSIPTVVNPTSGSWSTRPATSTHFTSTSHPNGQLPLGGDVSAENALSDSLVDHYHEVNQNVVTMELQIEQLNRQITITPYRSPYRAGPETAVLMNLQLVLEVAKKRRDQLLVTIIIQSKDIMTSVRLLRLVELGDVPEIPMIGHRTCLQLTNEIDRHKKSLMKLYQQFSEALNHSALINSSWEDLHIRIISASIQMHKKNIKKLQKAREVEFVRIVQFSYNVREVLKQVCHRQQLQRHQS